MILLKIAFRNLREHKVKTLVIGTLIAVGIAFLVIGNSVMESITRGMESSYVDNFTGDLIVRQQSDEEVSFIGGFGEAPRPLEGYLDISARLDARDDVVAHTPLLSGVAGISQNEETLSFALLWGIEPESYFAMFPDSFVITAGERLQSGDTGVMLSQAIIDDIASEHGIDLQIGDPVLLSGQNDVTGTKIREVPLRAIGSFANAAGLLDRISFVDANTLRTLTGLTAVQVGRAEPGSSLADTPSDEALFGDASDARFGDSLVREAAPEGDTPPDFDNILGDTSVREKYLALDNNAWHFILLDVAGNASAAAVGNDLLRDGTLGDAALVDDWRWGAGFIAELAYGIRNILNIIILVIAVVAVIIIMNALVISVTERISEIGTVRAIGGQKAFVRSMITAEVLMITLVFGLVGMGLGSLVIGVFNVIGLNAGNLFLQILFGGSVLKPVLSISSLFTSLIVVAVIGVVASLYPTSVALGIAPVQAMQKR